MGDKSPKSKQKQSNQKQAKIHKLEQKAAEDARSEPPSPTEGPGRNGAAPKR